MRKFLLTTATALVILTGGCGISNSDTPVHIDFEIDDDLDRVWWNCHNLYSLATDHATSGAHSLRCDLAAQRYPGVRFLLEKNDWAGLSTLSFDLFSMSGDTLSLVVRIDDRMSGEDLSNRYNGRFALFPGANRFEIPLDDLRQGPEGRLLDLSQIRLFKVFLVEPKMVPVLYFDNLSIQ